MYMCNGGGGAMLSGHVLNSPSHKGEAHILSKWYACEKVHCSLLPIQAAAPDHLTLQRISMRFHSKRWSLHLHSL